MRKFNKAYHQRPSFNLKDILSKSKLDLEIGPGVGWHPISYSLKNQDRFLIAIEHTANKFEKFKNRYVKHKCPENLLAVHANAITWITSNLPEKSLDKIFILYPNPNPLNKHKNLRFHNMPFMGLLIEKLKETGKIILASNEDFYIKEAKEVMCKEWKMKLLKEQNLLEEKGYQPRTHFEKKYLLRKEKCVELTFVI